MSKDKLFKNCVAAYKKINYITFLKASPRNKHITTRKSSFICQICMSYKMQDIDLNFIQ